MINKLRDKFDNVHYNYFSNVQSLSQDLSAILCAQYLNYIKLKGGSIRYDALCITSTYAHKANVSHPLHRVYSLCLECNMLLTHYSTKFQPQ